MPAVPWVSAEALLFGLEGSQPGTCKQRCRSGAGVAVANDVTWRYQLCEFETAATRGISYPVEVLQPDEFWAEC